MNKIRYTIKPVNPNAHLFAVSIDVTPSHGGPVNLTLPSWIPGSYMIRDFARNIITLSAQDCNGPLKVDKTDKQSWAVTHQDHEFTVTYQVYAWDLSVRSAHLDQNHGFFNGTSVFLAIEGQQNSACEIAIGCPDGEQYADWKIATGLKRSASTALFGQGIYLANDYQHMIDCPVEMGPFDHHSFESHGITHHLVFSGKHFGDMPRVTRDLKTLCNHHLDLFEIKPDISEYWFLTYITDNGFGGLEHGNSTALICSRFDLPSTNYPDKTDEGYKTFLSLCSHEYFHTWNVKRIKPAEFVPYELAAESYTKQLWAYEGFTSYYDDMSLARTGLVSNEDYLTLLSKTFSRVYRGKGRLKQTVAESSFDAWTKFYKQDENALNAIVSYYTKGSMVALCIDLMLRQATDNKHSLDDVMRLLWNKHGLTGQGTVEADFIEAINTFYPDDISEFLHQAIHTTKDLPLPYLLAKAGVELSFRRPTSATDLSGVKKQSGDYAPSLGILSKGQSIGVKVTHVLDDSAAQQAGISAGDILLAIDGLKVTSSTLETALAHIPRETTVLMTLFREDLLMTLEVKMMEAEVYVAQLEIIDADKVEAWLSV